MCDRTAVIIVPLIDLKPFLDNDDDSNDEDDKSKHVVREVAFACQQIGFFAIRNHGVDASIVEDAVRASAAFFDLPSSEKHRAITDDAAEYPFGYEQSEILDSTETGRTKSPPDLKETFSIGPTNPASSMPPRRIPSHPEELESTITHYYAAMEQLALKLAQILALGLRLPKHHFIDMMDHHQCALRLINYPNLTERPQPGQLRAGAHTDYGAFTILKCAGPGLQVKHDRMTEGWVDVPSFDSEDVFIINLGDMMQRWTNDKWVSTLHRVVAPPHDDGQDHQRRSIAFFVNINGDAVVETLPSCIDDENPIKYKPITAGQYVQHKYLKSMGEEERDKTRVCEE